MKRTTPDEDDAWLDEVPDTVDELLRRAREQGPEALDRLINSEIFKVLTQFDPRFSAEIREKKTDPKNEN